MYDDSIIYSSNPQNLLIQYKKDILSKIDEIITSGKYILGNEVEKFETGFSQYHNCKYGIGVANGTDAIYLTLKALGISKGDEVITTAYTALATISAICQTGATPVLVDIEEDFYTIDPKKIPEAISKHTKAIIPVHLAGQAADLDAILSIANSYDIPVIEDCAQAHGTLYKNQKVGSFGLTGCFSFYPTKNLGAIGDAGLIITNNQSFAEKLKQLRQYGWDKDRISHNAGINSRLDELQAAILNIKLNSLDQHNLERIEQAKKYFSMLSEVKTLTLPKVRSNSVHTFHLFMIQSKRRELLMKTMQDNKIICNIHYYPSLIQHPGYKDFIKISHPGSLAISESLSQCTLSLPCYPGLTTQDQNRVVNTLLDKYLLAG